MQYDRGYRACSGLDGFIGSRAILLGCALEGRMRFLPSPNSFLPCRMKSKTKVETTIQKLEVILQARLVVYRHRAKNPDVDLCGECEVNQDAESNVTGLHLCVHQA